MLEPDQMSEDERYSVVSISSYSASHHSSERDNGKKFIVLTSSFSITEVKTFFPYYR